LTDVSNDVSEIRVDSHPKDRTTREETQTLLAMQNVEDITNCQGKWLKHRNRIPPNICRGPHTSSVICYDDGTEKAQRIGERN